MYKKEKIEQNKGYSRKVEKKIPLKLFHVPQYYDKFHKKRSLFGAS